MIAAVEPGPDGTAARLARDVAFLDQRGCLSPQAVLVGPGVDAEALGRDLASCLRAIESEWPRRPLGLDEAGDFRRAVDEALSANLAGEPVTLHGGGPGEPWAVVVERGTSVRPSPLDRFVRLHPFADAEDLRAALAPLRPSLECIGLEAGDAHRSVLSDACREAGASRVCAIGAMQDPPAAWHASGRRPFEELLSWSAAEERRRPAEPGPERREAFLRHVAQTSDAPRGIEVASASGCWVHDAAGRSWLDLLAGIGVASIGHGRAEVAAAVARQAARYAHVMVYGEDVIEPQVELARRLAALLPPSLGVVYFTNSGAEGIEGAIKLARKATGRERVLSF
ncbi:MAG: aminotransferase class III-fold pyridoxal phosphate-dependent enzyme, partial [Alphaproteobacteria bacterium]